MIYLTTLVILFDDVLLVLFIAMMAIMRPRKKLAWNGGGGRGGWQRNSGVLQRSPTVSCTAFTQQPPYGKHAYVAAKAVERASLLCRKASALLFAFQMNAMPH